MLCQILLFPTAREAGGCKRSTVCCDEEEDEEEGEEGVSPAEHKRSSKNQRLAHVPPPCSCACQGLELMSCRVVLCRVSQFRNK